MRSQRWRHGVMLLSGAWLSCSPFLVSGYDEASVAAVWSSHIGGAAIVLVASVALLWPRTWHDWVSLVIGCGLIVAPLLLGFSNIAGVATSNHMLIGLLVGLDALSLIAFQRRNLQTGHAGPR